jgi:hypothetical protein
MSSSGSERKPRRLRGVTELPRSQGERRFRAGISRGKGRQVNLGLYPTRWLAAFAFNVAAELLHGAGRARNEIPAADQPTTEEVRRVTARVGRRLGLDEVLPPPDDQPPTTDALLTLLEIAVVEFWRGQVAGQDANPGRELDMAARRLVEAAQALFWSHSSGHPSALEALTQTLARRLDRVFRRGDLTRQVLDDEGDDPLQVARWLVYPDDLPGGGGFREAIGTLYADLPGMASARSTADLPGWAVLLGLAPPFSSERVRSAYRSRSKTHHPDIGGSHADFVLLQAAYEEAQRYCASRGL